MNTQVNLSVAACADSILSITAPRLTPRGPFRQRNGGAPNASVICDWPEFERPRERLLEQGPQSLSNVELIALILGFGKIGRSAVNAARSLLAEFGSLRELLSADRPRWEGKSGIGPARYAALMAVMELARRYHKEALVGPSLLANPEVVRKFLLVQLQDRHYEVFCCLYLDDRYRMLGFEEMFRGTIDRADVHAREIVRQLLNYDAASIIVAHNHPSGCSEPSRADEELTQRLRRAFALIDVRLVDHYVVGDSQCYSFAEHGLL